MPTAISIVEDEPSTRESLRRLLARAGHLRCLSTYASGEEALRGIPAEKPDVVLVDINLPGMSGIECVAKLKLKLPALRVLMLTTYEDSDRIFDSLRAGQADVSALPRPNLIQYSAQLPGSRVLADRFGVNLVAIAVPKGQSGRLAYIAEFIKEANASGLVKRAIERAGLQGVQVAPPAKSN